MAPTVIDFHSDLMLTHRMSLESMASGHETPGAPKSQVTSVTPVPGSDRSDPALAFDRAPSPATDLVSAHIPAVSGAE